MSQQEQQPGRGGVSLPELSENESAKWKNFYSTKLPGTASTKSKKIVPGAASSKNNNENPAAGAGEGADNNAAANNNQEEQQQARGKKKHKPLHRGKVREGELDSKSFMKKKAEEAE